MPSAREAAIEAMARARSRQTYGPGHWDTLGRGEQHLRAAYERVVLDALLAPSEERCTECGGEGVDHHDMYADQDTGWVEIGTCPSCSGSGKRSSAPLIVEALREMGYTVHEKRWIDTEEARELFASDSPSSTSEETP